MDIDKLAARICKMCDNGMWCGPAEIIHCAAIEFGLVGKYPDSQYEAVTVEKYLEKERKDEMEKMKYFTTDRCPLDEQCGEPFFAATEAKEKAVNTNAKINNKEEKKMANVNGRIVSKDANTPVIPEAETKKEEKTMSLTERLNALEAEQRAKLSEANPTKDFGIGAEAPKGLACKENLGLQERTITSMTYGIFKREAKEDEGKPASFLRMLEISTEEDPIPFRIMDPMFLYNSAGKLPVDVFTAVTDGAGTTGCYMTVNALEKKPEELDLDKDVEIHILSPGQRIWRPARAEFVALNKAFGVPEIEFDAAGNAIIPEGMKVNVFVYEDVVEIKTTKNVKGKIKEFKDFKYYYNASFVAPEDQYEMKYGRRFTTSKNAAHRAELAELEGVKRYLESC